MSKYIGRKVAIGFGKETVRGTAVAPTYWVPQSELTLDEKVTQAVDESSIGVIENAIDSKVVERMVEGNVKVHVGADSIGLFLLSGLGAVTTTLDDPATGANTHAFSVLQSAQHPSFTIAEVNPDENVAYALGMVESMEFALALQEFSSVNVTVRAKKGATATNTVALAEETKFIPQDISLKLATDLAGLGVATPICVKAINLTITKNLEDDRCFGSTDPSDINNKQLVIEGTFEALYSSDALKTLVTGATPQAMRVRFTSADEVVTGTPYQLTIDLARVKLTEIARNLTNNDLVRQTLSFKAYYSIADSQSITAELINDVTAY